MKRDTMKWLSISLALCVAVSMTGCSTGHDTVLESRSADGSAGAAGRIGGSDGAAERTTSIDHATAPDTRAEASDGGAAISDGAMADAGTGSADAGTGGDAGAGTAQTASATDAGGIAVSVDADPDPTSDDGAVSTPDAGSESNADAASADGGGGPSPCVGFCAQLNALDCPDDDPSTCVGQCQAVSAGTECGAFYQAMVTCGVHRPADDFTCDNGSATLVETACADEQQAFADCLAFGPI